MPINLAGALTILFLVGFGIFLYPWLLKRRGGLPIVLLLTAALATMFYFFDEASGVESGTSRLLGLIWALLPLGTGFLVKYAQQRGISH